jgi:Heparinase II/III-like protein
VIACLASHSTHQQMMPPDAPQDLRTVLFNCSLEAMPVQDGVYLFNEGGYTVIREQYDQNQALLMMDHGPLGYLSIAAHGHADALSIWLSIDGEQVLVDAGTYLYHSGGAWRSYFRGTPAHNTLSINGDNQSKIVGNFNWTNHARTEILEQYPSLGGWRIKASHDGFVERYGVHHERLLEKTGQGFTVVDTLKGSVDHEVPVEIGFLFGPGMTPLVEKNGWLITGLRGPVVRIHYDSVLKGFLQQGEDTPPRGWYSPHFGQKHSVYRLCFSGKLGVRGVHKTIFTLV